LYRAIDLLGPEETKSVLEETLKIQEDGGVYLESHNRFRSLGGIFFDLAKKRLPVGFRNRHKTVDKPRPVWERRLKHYGRRNHGRIKSMEIKVTGRPKEAFNRGEYYEIPMVQKGGVELGIPKGLPIPPDEKIKCVLYISAKKWRKIASEVYEDETAIVVAKGILYPDYEQGRMIVFCKDISTFPVKPIPEVK
jgi:hypothetical protein